MRVRCCLLAFIAAMFMLPVRVCAQADSTANISVAADTLASGDSLPHRTRREVHVTSASPEVTHVHTTDSVLRKKHSPKLAIGLSAVLPGAGQVYNRKWWKVPIVYAFLGAGSYCIYHFASEMKVYRTEYRYRMQERFDLIDPQLGYYSDDNILSLKKKYQRYMEISIAATAIFYVLNIIDAAVDAHLFYFDISNDLSLRFTPYFEPQNMLQRTNGGVALALRWK